ncbi:hypothetical protein RM844_28445 [Streptomyces sp. DSM 44915]|uniref:DUF3592 domain-containing protein n=1 Tax=Streptomyces chisholmiae TaxID=3075540 RepID=A0ABU2JYY2_9ACTN|nr:hypothetical protein [Streptomyces sp. DSM 44915]MDT0270207.1 hypothetical protein [Streptomyces sp. DSM 44915]
MPRPARPARRPTPTPLGPPAAGWALTGTLLGLVCLPAAVATWSVLAHLLADEEETWQLFPAGTRWPELAEGTATALVFGCVVLALLAQSVLDRLPTWERSPDAFAAPGRNAVLGGVALGAFAATPGFRDPLGAALVWSLGLACGCVTAVLVGRLTRDVEGLARRRARVARLRAHGTRVRAEVLAVEVPLWVGDRPRFTVRARFHTPRGTLVATGELLTEVAQAPVVGGTVLLWYDAEDDADVLVARDPGSVRDPLAQERYRPPACG